MHEHEIKVRWKHIKGRKYEVEGVIMEADSPEQAIEKWCRTKKPCEVEGSGDDK